MTIQPDTTQLDSLEIDARGLYYRDLNARIREKVAGGCRHLVLHHVCGQRYIGTGLREPLRIDIEGTPGNDLGAFMDGPTVIVHGNAQDACGNTLGGGEMVVYGRAGDTTGYSMRGGEILIQGDVGYRAGIHMKECGDRRPAIVIGGACQPFLGEYMAGGIILLLGLSLRPGERLQANFIGTGMHGGVIYLRCPVESWQLGAECGTSELNEQDWRQVRRLVQRYTHYFGGDAEEILQAPFTKVFPLSRRPYGNLYAY